VITASRFSCLGRALQGSGSEVNWFPKRMFIIWLLGVISQEFEANHGIKTWKIYHYEAACTI
jgi:phage tail protein X